MSQFIALASAARTASAVSSAIISQSTEGAGCHVILDVTAVAATPSITLKVEAQDPASLKWYELLAGAAVTTVSTTVYKVHPAMTSAANSVAKDFVPRTIRISVDHLDADSITYSVGVNFG